MPVAAHKRKETKRVFFFPRPGNDETSGSRRTWKQFMLNFQPLGIHPGLFIADTH